MHHCRCDCIRVLTGLYPQFRWALWTTRLRLRFNIPRCDNGTKEGSGQQAVISASTGHSQNFFLVEAHRYEFGCQVPFNVSTANECRL